MTTNPLDKEGEPEDPSRLARDLERVEAELVREMNLPRQELLRRLLEMLRRDEVTETPLIGRWLILRAAAADPRDPRRETKDQEHQEDVTLQASLQASHDELAESLIEIVDQICLGTQGPTPVQLMRAASALTVAAEHMQDPSYAAWARAMGGVVSRTRPTGSDT